MKKPAFKHSNRSERGFSLVELLVVVVILLSVTSIVLMSISQLQRRSTNETAKLDSTQETREFLDQVTRDIHQIGYPNTRMSAGVSPALAGVTASVAIPGLVSVTPVSATPNSIIFEGDLDGSGTVQEVFLQLVAGPGNTCPCTVQRGVETKAAYIGGAVPPFFTQLNNVINSGGQYAIAGSDKKGNAYDTLFASYKAAPVFQLYDNLGAPTAVANSVKTILVTVNVLSPRTDQETGEPAVVTMTTTSRLNN
jgi:prepilin-type N-terminal cleavage/methylation domain-containing protein